MKRCNSMFSVFILVSVLTFPAPAFSCSIYDASNLTGLEYSEWETIAIEKQIAINKRKQRILDKIEAEQKAKKEAQQANTSPTDPAGIAQWENNKFGDVHDRANYLVANPNHLDASENWNDSETLLYLQTLRDDLKMSGEMQLQAHLEGAF